MRVEAPRELLAGMAQRVGDRAELHPVVEKEHGIAMPKPMRVLVGDASLFAAAAQHLTHPVAADRRPCTAHTVVGDEQRIACNVEAVMGQGPLHQVSAHQRTQIGPTWHDPPVPALALLYSHLLANDIHVGLSQAGQLGDPQAAPEQDVEHTAVAAFYPGCPTD